MLVGPVYIVTGASSGIGAAVTRALVADGASVLATARDQARLDGLAREVDAAERLAVQVADAGDWKDTCAAVDTCVERFGRIDGVVANAGYTLPGDMCTSDVALWPALVATNLLGPAYLVRAALPQLRDSAGRVVIIGSVAGHKNSPGNLYSAAKWGVTGLAENLRMMLVDDGIGVSLVSPGVVDTAFYANGTPATHLGADDIARTVGHILTQPAEVDLSTVVIRPRRQVM
jgi:NADP-dependent 3-hydroxy acid dehydrogenase YdfG